MDFIDEEDVVAFKVGEYSGKVAGTLNGRTGGRLDIDAYLNSNDMGETGLTQAGRSVKKSVVEGLTALAGGDDRNCQVFPDLVLTDKVGQRTRPEAGFKGRVLDTGLAGCDAGDVSPPDDCLQFTVNGRHLARDGLLRILN